MLPRVMSRRRAAGLLGAAAVLAACGGNSAPTTAGSPSQTPTPSPTPSASHAPVAKPPTCPLTGKPVAKGENVHHPVLAVKIDNIDLARPQSGIDHADVVVEETVEGGLTRLFAVFQCTGGVTIGPVRSGRTSDVGLLRLFSATPAFGFSGSNSGVAHALARASHAVLLSYDANGGLYYRSSQRAAPHNVYTSTKTLLKAAVARKKGLKAPDPLFRYAVRAPKGKRVHGISLHWSGFTSAGWTWNGRAWARTQNGTPDKLTDGNRVTAANVIVMHIKVASTGLRDVLGNASPDDVVTGHGKAVVFRDGRRIWATWSRDHLWSALRFSVGKGHPLTLAPGHTWIELLPASGSISFH